DGTAMWFAAANYEYQSLNLTWLGRFPVVFSALTHLTVFWEVFYCALVWPKLTRPVVLAIAVAVHGGIALFLGMVTFGTIMIVANMAFVSPDWIAEFTRISYWRRSANLGSDSERSAAPLGEAAVHSRPTPTAGNLRQPVRT